MLLVCYYFSSQAAVVSTRYTAVGADCIETKKEKIGVYQSRSESGDEPKY
jgi:hypothetical protein